MKEAAIIFLVFLSGLCIGCNLVGESDCHKKAKENIELRKSISIQEKRIDHLYEMFIDLLKERKNG